MTALMLVLLSVGLYTWGVVRVRRARRAFPARAVVAFACGLAVTAASLLGPVDRLADESLAWHMAQHLALVSLAA
ncbi:MAG: hypothetical protein JWM87_3892, partial [Candidatus Eremiobacteraeota bacterium]|nr:hypothetical protein [Candidatus Eremiobacteraeota bacterium]